MRPSALPTVFRTTGGPCERSPRSRPGRATRSPGPGPGPVLHDLERSCFVSESLHQKIDAAVAHIRKTYQGTPRFGLILGTGLGSLSDELEVEARVPYGEIPHFPVSTAESHAGVLELGRVAGEPCAVMKGRVHFYEGYSMQEVTFPIRVLRALGAQRLLITNAVGGLSPTFRLGDLFVTTDHINLMGDNPLIGPNDDTLGPRFPDMSEPYDRDMVERLESIALREQIPLRKGVFVAVAGPNLETRAEYRFLRWIGADVVGMSLIPENIVAIHGGMRVAAVSVITDMGLPDALEPVDIARILAIAEQARPKLAKLVVGLIESLHGVADA
ncbi:MAG: purine-nucleoside phosphorylase [Candidatus Eisenbacteria bacterium]|uniref:Purine nucleoside phosphorylase n=1 Tax=Eiseniibacteriota bacterium TaxID=2212470 RepID=A0A956LVJ7_UNCEI|nr:purine-nucleoside phosphorylase [Candidatus Eisenbacteria bacterium]